MTACPVHSANTHQRPKFRAHFCGECCQRDIESFSFVKNVVSACSGSSMSSVSIVTPHFASTACCTGSARGMNANDCGRLIVVAGLPPSLPQAMQQYPDVHVGHAVD